TTKTVILKGRRIEHARKKHLPV
ncbi:unnamed protein product, partial [Allacma fusca]